MKRQLCDTGNSGLPEGEIHLHFPPKLYNLEVKTGNNAICALTREKAHKVTHREMRIIQVTIKICIFNLLLCVTKAEIKMHPPIL